MKFTMTRKGCPFLYSLRTKRIEWPIVIGVWDRKRKGVLLMMMMICLFFPAVLSVWCFEQISKRELGRKQWGYYYVASVLEINLFCFLVKRFVLGTGEDYMYSFYNDLTPKTAGNYLIMSIPCALLLGVLFSWLNAYGKKIWVQFAGYIKRHFLFCVQKEPAENLQKKVIKLSLIILPISMLSFFSAIWYVKTYGKTGFDSIIYTLTSSLDGVQSDLVHKFLEEAAMPAMLITVLVDVLLVLLLKWNFTFRIAGKYRIRTIMKRTTALTLSLLFSLGMMVKATIDVELYEYLYDILNPSQFYQEKYIDPSDVAITFPEKKRNLVYIFLESMETTFFSRQEGGALRYNVIPELYKLAENNVNFSQDDSIGGFSGFSGATWTIGALVAQTAGIPLKTPIGVGGNDYGQDGTFLPGVKSITNILHDNGYNQLLMIGSDAKFGGRKMYYESHGIDRILDHGQAMQDGIISEGYNVWWGMEDSYLFEYAKQELEELSDKEEPFALTMLTVDTHHVNGYVCDLCERNFAEQYENVYQCASKQMGDFVNWLKEQDFFENTTVVIVGDHCSMDAAYMSRNVDDDYDRQVYNCFINSATEAVQTKRREFTPLDMFPTTLAALGCNIEGDRLGLGTNLFSNQPTLAEELGLKKFERECNRKSSYYETNFY